MRAAHLRIALLALPIAIATGCGGGMNAANTSTPPANCVPSTRPSFAYVLSYSNPTISMYSADSCTGALTPMNPATIPTGAADNGFNAESMAIDATGKFLYVANLGSNAVDAATISMFTINSNTGLLTATSPSQVATGFFPQGIAASANFVYTANSDDNSVSMFTIDTGNGSLTPLSPSEIFVPPLIPEDSTVSSPDFVTVGPTGQFLYVTDQDNGSISIFSIDSETGALTPTTPAGVDVGDDPWHLTFDPSGRFAYVSDEDLGRVDMYSVDATTGMLTAIPPIQVAAGNQPAYIAVHPSGKSAYVVNRYDGTVSMYGIDATTGSLTPKNPATVQAGSWPYSIAVNSAGTFAYVGNQGGTISIYSIDSTTGVLVPAGTVQNVDNPIGIVLVN